MATSLITGERRERSVSGNGNDRAAGKGMSANGVKVLQPHSQCSISSILQDLHCPSACLNLLMPGSRI